MDISSETKQPYLISNLENKGKEVGSQNAPYFFKITSGQRDSKSLIFHAQIGTEYFMYRIRGVYSKSINLACKFPGCPAQAFAHIPKSSGLIFVKGTRSNGQRQVKTRLEILILIISQVKIYVIYLFIDLEVTLA